MAWRAGTDRPVRVKPKRKEGGKRMRANRLVALAITVVFVFSAGMAFAGTLDDVRAAGFIKVGERRSFRFFQT